MKSVQNIVSPSQQYWLTPKRWFWMLLAVLLFPAYIAQQEIYDEAEHLIYMDSPSIFLFMPQEVEAASAFIHNWQPSPDSHINLRTVWLSE